MEGGPYGRICGCEVLVFGWTCTTPANEVGGTGWVGSLATVARWPARPSDMEAGDVSTFVVVDVTIVVGLVMGTVAPEESCWASREEGNP